MMETPSTGTASRGIHFSVTSLSGKEMKMEANAHEPIAAVLTRVVDEFDLPKVRYSLFHDTETLAYSSTVGELGIQDGSKLTLVALPELRLFSSASVSMGLEWPDDEPNGFDAFYGHDKSCQYCGADGELCFSWDGLIHAQCASKARVEHFAGARVSCSGQIFSVHMPPALTAIANDTHIEAPCQIFAACLLEGIAKDTDELHLLVHDDHQSRTVFALCVLPADNIEDGLAPLSFKAEAAVLSCDETEMMLVGGKCIGVAEGGGAIRNGDIMSVLVSGQSVSFLVNGKKCWDAESPVPRPWQFAVQVIPYIEGCFFEVEVVDSCRKAVIG